MMQTRLLVAVAALTTLSGAIIAPSFAQPPQKKISYEKQVKPVLKKYCYACHNPQDPGGKLDLTTIKGIKKGGVSGPAVKAKKSKESWLIIRMKGEKKKPIMPPGRRKPTKEQIKMISDWIDQGPVYDADK